MRILFAHRWMVGICKENSLHQWHSDGQHLGIELWFYWGAAILLSSLFRDYDLTSLQPGYRKMQKQIRKRLGQVLRYREVCIYPLCDLTQWIKMPLFQYPIVLNEFIIMNFRGAFFGIWRVLVLPLSISVSFICVFCKFFWIFRKELHALPSPGSTFDDFPHIFADICL